MTEIYEFIFHSLSWNAAPKRDVTCRYINEGKITGIKTM